MAAPALSPWTPALLHVRLLSTVVVRGLTGFVPVAAEAIPRSTAPADPDLPRQRVTGVGPIDPEIPLTDEDNQHRPPYVQRVIHFANDWLPFRDDPRELPGSAEGLLASAFGAFLPAPHFTWPDLDTPEGLSLFVRQGLGAHRVVRDGDGVALKMNFLSAFDVRPGLARYGGDAHLDGEGRLVGLKFGDAWVRPGDPSFAADAFRFRSTVVSGVTLLDHLGTCHYGVSNALLVATRRQLGPDHALRQLLRPFLFRTAATNANALASLLPTRGLVGRGTGFARFEEPRSHMLDEARFEPFEAGLRRRGVHPDDLPPALAAALPFSVDGLAYNRRLGAFVADAFTRSAALAGVLDGAAGEATRAWWDDLGARLVGGLPALDRAALIEVMAWAAYVVTAFHAHVGHVAPYVRDARVAAGRPVLGAVRSDPQNALQMGVVAVTTGVEVPRIDQDLSRLMPDAGALAAWITFQAALAAQQAEVDARNAARPVPFPAFSPRCISCSVST